MRIFPNDHGETEKALQSLKEKWQFYANRYRACPGWVVIEDTATVVDEEKNWGITYVSQKNKLLSPRDVSERLSSCYWGIEVDEETGKIHRLG